MKHLPVVYWGAILWCMPSMAQAITLWPLMPEIRSSERSTAIYIDNNTHERKRFQLRIRSWKVEDGQESLELQQKVLPSPAMLEIEPGQRQLVRLVYVAEDSVPDYAVEQSYRVIVDDISSETGEPGNQLNVRMRYILPLFIGRPADDKERLNQLLSGTLYVRDGRSSLHIHNRANRHVRLSAVNLLDADNEIELSSGLLGYILPGSTNYFVVQTSDQLQRLETGQVIIEARQGRTTLRFPVGVKRLAESG